MSNSPLTQGIVSARLDDATLAENFSDLHAPLDAHEAAVAADRCYFCHDAPCVTACPTDIDVPLFIRQIQTGTPLAAGQTILEQNILGGMCACARLKPYANRPACVKRRKANLLRSDVCNALQQIRLWRDLCIRLSAQRTQGNAWLLWARGPQDWLRRTVWRCWAIRLIYMINPNGWAA